MESRLTAEQLKNALNNVILAVVPQDVKSIVQVLGNLLNEIRQGRGSTYCELILYGERSHDIDIKIKTAALRLKPKFLTELDTAFADADVSGTIIKDLLPPYFASKMKAVISQTPVLEGRVIVNRNSKEMFEGLSDMTLAFVNTTFPNITTF